jgi:hypothetical protein
MEKYCDIVDVENYLLKSIESGFQTQVEQWIRGVSRYMDTLANRTLVAPAIGSGEDFEVRYYDGTGRASLRIDDCQEIISVSVGNFYGDNPVTLSPNAILPYPKKAPYRQMLSRSSIFYLGVQNIAVEGRFGFFNEVPADIRLSCATIVAGIINAQDKGNAEKKSESIGNYSVSYKDATGFNDYDNAIATVKNYLKIEF